MSTAALRRLPVPASSTCCSLIQKIAYSSPPSPLINNLVSQAFYFNEVLKLMLYNKKYSIVFITTDQPVQLRLKNNLR